MPRLYSITELARLLKRDRRELLRNEKLQAVAVTFAAGHEVKLYKLPEAAK